MNKVSITIPIYNEEKSIARTAKSLVSVFEAGKIDYELVLVNHGSKDNSKGIILELARKNKKIKAINLPKNLGYGGGIMYGMEHSKGDYLGWTCADEEVSAEDTIKIIKQILQNKYDVVKAQRINRQDGNFRRLTSYIFNILIRIRFDLRLKDINGFPLIMSKSIYPKVKAKEKTHLFNLDLLRNIKKNNYSILEIPVTHQKRKAGKSFMKPLRILEMATDLLVYALKFRRNFWRLS